MDNGIGKHSVEDTLCFFYFGFTLDELKQCNESILERIIKKAYFDATMQGAFNANVKRKDKKDAEKAKDDTIDYLKKVFLNIEEKSDQDQFNRWHEKTCNEVIDKFRCIKDADKELFTYGNAQKVVNMSLKYLYMLGKSSWYKESDNTFNVIDEVNKMSSFLHMPIDSYIIDQLLLKEIITINYKNEVVDLREKLKNVKKEYPKRNQLKDCVFPHEYIKPWSQWGEPEYNLVQEQIRDSEKRPDRYKVIAWENDLWIEESIRRRDRK